MSQLPGLRVVAASKPGHRPQLMRPRVAAPCHALRLLVEPHKQAHATMLTNIPQAKHALVTCKGVFQGMGHPGSRGAAGPRPRILVR